MKPGALILHPIVLGALALWAVNDHVLKAYGGVLPGKLSDVACLIVIPVMLPSAIELWRSRGGRVAQPATRWVIACALLAASIMVPINVSTPAAWLFEHGMGVLQWPIRALGGRGYAPVHLTMDPTDAFTLPAALVPIVLAHHRQGAPSKVGSFPTRSDPGSESIDSMA